MIVYILLYVLRVDREVHVWRSAITGIGSRVFNLSWYTDPFKILNVAISYKKNNKRDNVRTRKSGLAEKSCLVASVI